MFSCGVSIVENLNMSMPAGKRVARLKKKKQLSWGRLFWNSTIFFSLYFALLLRKTDGKRDFSIYACMHLYTYTLSQVIP